MRNELPKRYPMFSFVPSFSFFYHCLSSHLSRGISFALAGQVSSGRRLLEKIMSPEDCDCFRAFRVSRRLGRTNEATRDVSASGSPFLSYGDKMNDTHRFPDRSCGRDSDIYGEILVPSFDPAPCFTYFDRNYAIVNETSA